MHKGSAYVKATRIKINSAAIEEIGRLHMKGFSMLAKIFLDCGRSSTGERIKFFQQLRSYVLAGRSLPASVSLTRNNREAAAAEFKQSAIVLFSREEEEQQGEQADIDIRTKLLRLGWEQLGARDYDTFCKSCKAVGIESRISRSADTGKSFASQLPPEWIALLREDNPTRYYDGLTGWRGRVPRLPTYSVKRLAPEDLRLLKRCAKLIVQDGDTAQEAVITDWLLLRTLRMGRGAGYIHNELCTYMEQSRQTAAPGADANSYISTFESDGTASAVSGDARMVERYSETSSQGTSAQMIF